MYSHCLFCQRSLGANDRIERFPVGRRLAYDMSRGRLWVVCAHCRRWNLTPIEERWEAIEDCERLYRGTTVRVSTANVGLARVRGGFELVRIGAPLRPEFAAWRYGTRFAQRRRVFRVAAGAGAVTVAAVGVAVIPAIAPALALGAISIVAFPGLTSVMGAIPVVGALAVRDYLVHDRVVARFSQGKRVVTVRAKHLGSVSLHYTRDDRSTLDVPHDGGWAHFEGTAAVNAAGVLLSGANRFGATDDQVQHAVSQIEQHGDTGGYLAAASNLGDWRLRVGSLINRYRDLGVMRLSPTECLALEMAMNEEAERRALDGELAALEAAWRDAERIAEICDHQLTPGFEHLLGRRRDEDPEQTGA